MDNTLANIAQESGVMFDAGTLLIRDEFKHSFSKHISMLSLEKAVETGSMLISKTDMLDQFHEAYRLAWNELTYLHHSPAPDPEMVQQSLADHDAGKSITTEEFLERLGGKSHVKS